MTKLKLLAVFAAIVFAMSLGLQAQVPCLPDCPNDIFQPPYPAPPLSIEVELCPGNMVTVYYRHRIACGTWYDYYIEMIEGSIADCFPQFGGSYGSILQYLAEQLIIANPANFPPNEEGDCENNWRVMKGSCWYFDYIISTGNPHDRLKACTTSDCCLEYYRVCITNGVRVITQTGYLPPEDPQCEINPYGLNCQPVCGSIYNR